MNIVALTGRLVRDPEIRYTNSGLSVARFNIAVDRDFKKEGGPDADFPSIIAFGKTAEFIENYFTKGKKIEISGRIQTGSYEKEDGTRVYTTDVVADRVGFGESMKYSGSHVSSGKSSAKQDAKPDADGFMQIPDGIDEELPF